MGAQTQEAACAVAMGEKAESACGIGATRAAATASAGKARESEGRIEVDMMISG